MVRDPALGVGGGEPVAPNGRASTLKVALPVVVVHVPELFPKNMSRTVWDPALTVVTRWLAIVKYVPDAVAVFTETLGK